MLSRRSFVKSLAMAMGAVAPGFAGHFRNEVTWEFFTDDWQGSRFNLQTPWSIGDRTYASDGRILVSDFGCQETSSPLNRKLPDLSLLHWEKFDSGGWKPASSLILGREANETMCPTCMGFGRVSQSPEFQVIEDFDGDPVRRIVNGFECLRCEGEGWVEDEPLFEADGMAYSPGYVARIKTLGDFDFKVVNDGTINSFGHPEAPMLFRFGNSGKGMLMNQMRL